MAVVLLFLICAGILVLQGSLFPLFWPLAYQPDPLLVLVISLSILLGEKRGSLVGLAAGLLQDILFGPALGLFALSKVATAYLAGLPPGKSIKTRSSDP
jgi:rod shape-determining protein MreD